MLKIIFTTLIALITLNATVFAYQNEPDGFRQYKWGMSVQKVMAVADRDKIIYNNKTFHPDKHFTHYELYPHKSNIGGLNFVVPISLSFYNNKLYSVKIIMFEYLPKDKALLISGRTSLRRLFSSLYGEPKRYKIDDLILWLGNKTEINIETMYHGFMVYDDAVYLTYTSEVIDQERIKAQRTKEISEASAGY